jgi:acylphosphatase
MKRVRVVISGRVQGVWFRGWTEQQAARRGLDGWVRNSWDGSVEAVFQGEDAEVDAMIEACRDGPQFAAVTDVEQFDHDEPVDPGFVVRPRGQYP